MARVVSWFLDRELTVRSVGIGLDVELFSLYVLACSYPLTINLINLRFVQRCTPVHIDNVSP